MSRRLNLASIIGSWLVAVLHGQILPVVGTPQLQSNVSGNRYDVAPFGKSIISNTTKPLVRCDSQALKPAWLAEE